MKNIITFLSKNYFLVQSLTLWVVALLHIQEFTFWYFGVSAMLVGGIGEILSELRGLKEKPKSDETE
jgi:hypothetical protein